MSGSRPPEGGVRLVGGRASEPWAAVGVAAGGLRPPALPTRWTAVRFVLAGREVADHDGRRLRLDADTWLVLDGRTSWSGAAADPEPTLSACVWVAPQALRDANAPKLPCPDGEACGFIEALRPREGPVATALQRVAALAMHGGDAALEVAVSALVDAVVDAERHLRALESRIDCVKPSTRRELLRRVLRATDYIHTHHELRITLADIAAAASLSRFHLARLFRATLGSTPAAYLREKRLRVARRLIARSTLDLDEVALRSGFGTRSSLFRHLRRELGNGGRALRAGRSEVVIGACEPCRTPA